MYIHGIGAPPVPHDASTCRLLSNVSAPRSLPARSMNEILPTRRPSGPPVLRANCMIECDREESAFAAVLPVLRLFPLSSISCRKTRNPPIQDANRNGMRRIQRDKGGRDARGLYLFQEVDAVDGELAQSDDDDPLLGVLEDAELLPLVQQVKELVPVDLKAADVQVDVAVLRAGEVPEDVCRRSDRQGAHRVGLATAGLTGDEGGTRGG